MESSPHRDVPNIPACCVDHHIKVHPQRSERTLNLRTKSSWHLQNREFLPRKTCLRRNVRIVASMCFKVKLCIKININLFKSPVYMSLAVCPGGWVPIPGQGMLCPSTLPVCSSCQRVWVRTSPQQTPPIQVGTQSSPPTFWPSQRALPGP